MPRVTQYIRDEDFEVWKAIENKSEFIHQALDQKIAKALPEIKKIDKELSVSEKADFLSEAYVEGNKAYEGLCEHFAAKGFCKKSKCKNSMFNPKNK